MKHATLLDRIVGSGARWWDAHYAAAADRAAGVDAIVLSVGEIGLPPPVEMQEFAARRLLDGRHKYSMARGEPGIRAAIAAKYSARAGREVGPEHVLFANGAQTCLALLVQSLIDPGDAILMPEPRYLTYGGIAAVAGVETVPVILQPENGFHLTPELIRAAATPKTRALMLNSPHNPTGATLSRREVRAICEAARELDLWIISDEVYEDYVYGAEFASPFDDPEFADQTFVVSSISKSRAVPGWRCGWIVGPPEILQRTVQLFEIVVFSNPPFLQDATAFALSKDFAESAETRATLAKRARTIPAALSQCPGITAPSPEGGIFLFVNIRDTGLSDLEFARQLYETEKVSVMPGSAFGPENSEFVRICFAGTDRDMEEACTRLRRFADSVSG